MTQQPAPYRGDGKLHFGIILEARTHFLGEELRLLPGCDVPALFELVVVAQAGIRALRPIGQTAA